jgi:hypothetical protein
LPWAGPSFDIGIGSTGKSVRHAYPKARSPKVGGVLIIKSRQSTTSFYVFHGIVYEIAIVST